MFYLIFDIKYIKKCIGENKAKEAELKPVPKPIPDIDDSRLEEIYKRLDEEFFVGNFLQEDLVKQKIIEFNYDYEKIKNWVEAHI